MLVLPEPTFHTERTKELLHRGLNVSLGCVMCCNKLSMLLIRHPAWQPCMPRWLCPRGQQAFCAPATRPHTRHPTLPQQPDDAGTQRGIRPQTLYPKPCKHGAGQHLWNGESGE